MLTEKTRETISRAYSSRDELYDSPDGKTRSELRKDAIRMADEALAGGKSMISIRADIFEYLLRNGRVGVPEEGFADACDCEGILTEFRWKCVSEFRTPRLEELNREISPMREDKFVAAEYDFGHLCPDWRAIIRLGFTGIADRVREYAGKNTDPSKRDFYIAAEKCWRAVAELAVRLSKAAEKVGREDVRDDMLNLSRREPRTFREGLALMILTFRVFEYIDGERTRSLGGLDRQLIGLYRADIACGVSAQELDYYLAVFLWQCWSMKVPYDLPMYLAGQNADGSDASNELTGKIIDVYMSLDIYSPKIHVRVAPTTPESILLRVCDSIRKGNNSFLFINDYTVIKSLLLCGETEEDARDYVPIGCYEPVAFGKEVGCTGNGDINVAKAVELTLNDGFDPTIGKQVGLRTGDPESFDSFDEFFDKVVTQLERVTSLAAEVVSEWERNYAEIYPIPLFSATYKSCLESGTDALCGGAEYNNSSLTYACVGSAVDSLIAVKAAYDGAFDLSELRAALRADWSGYEKLRAELDRLPRYGNGDPAADDIAHRLTAELSRMQLGRPNGRGGIFKPGLFSIDHCIPFGEATGATPDGRRAGDPLSRNTCAVSGKDRNGVTALMRSASALCQDRFPNGTVLDIMLHPSAVSGEGGSEILLSLVKSYFGLGGFALHGNVVSADTLEAAKREPEKYSTLQVRLCGWNVYFVDLSEKEQDELIRQAK